MDNKERLLVYPYGVELAAVIRHRDMLCGYEVSELVSPPGWGFAGKDAGFVDGSNGMGIIIADDFEAALHNCDTVLFGEACSHMDFIRVIEPKIQAAADMGKNIILTAAFDSESCKIAESICQEKGVSCKQLGCSRMQALLHGNEEILELLTPVVFVLGITERTNKFEAQLALRRRVQQSGYRISQVGSTSSAELFGFHSFPSFMKGHAYSEQQKIVMFNRYIKKIEAEEKPDLIVIGIPGGCMPISSKLPNGFGITAFEVSRAVVPDAAVLGLPYDEYEKAHLEGLLSVIKNRLGIEIDCFSLSNTKLDWDTALQEGNMSYVTLDSKFIENRKVVCREQGFPVYNVLNPGDASDMADSIIGKLEKYAAVQPV